MVGVIFCDIHIRFAWQVWHLWHWAGSGGTLEDAFEWNLKCVRTVSRYTVVAFIVALTTSYIRVVYSCGQVLFRSVIVVGPVAVGQLSSEFAVVH